MGDAAGDPEWAAGQLASIGDDKVTTGLFYDDDGTRHTFVSGEDDAEHVAEILAEVGAPASPIGTYPAASHAEIKAAAAMRDGDMVSGVMVINHGGGPCPGDLGPSLMCWMSSGGAGRGDAVLAHDSWNQHETRFPPEAFITTTELRATVLQWAFGETFPPSAVEWTEVRYQRIGWR